MKQSKPIPVKDFMSKPVRTIPPGTTVEKAIQIMANKNVGSLVVTNGQGPMGILSERDLVSKLIATGKKADTTSVSEIMSGQIVRFNPGDSIHEAARTMNSRKNRILVFEHDRMTGILTATDIVRAIHELGSAFQIGKTISKNVYTLNMDAPLEEAVQVMTQLWVGSVIIMDDDYRPDGIFTERDLVKKVLAPGLDMKQAVGTVSSRPLITAEEEVDGKAAADIMTVNHIKRLPLTQNDTLAGIVTARDLVEAFAYS